MKVNMKIVLNVLLALFAVALQVQWTGVFFETPIRLGTSDVLLPILLLLVTANSISKQGLSSIIIQTLRWPLWFSIFTLWFGLSIVVGYYETGIISTWAIVNKFLGWCLLVGYFFLGNIIARDNYQKIEMMLKALFISSALISTACFTAYIIYYPEYKVFGSHDLLLDENNRFTGFLGNGNAMGLLSAFIVLIQLPYFWGNKLFSRSTHFALMLPNIMLIIFSPTVGEIFSRSRTAKLALIIGASYFFMIKLYEYKVLNAKRLLLVGVLALVCISCLDCKKISQNYYNLYKEHKVTVMSLRERIETTEHAVQWWLEKPILGIGLGTFWEKQKNFSSKITLHNTPLWLLTEMGLVGFLLFVWFFVKARRVILTKTQECAEDFLAQGMLIVFPAFLVSSLTTEIFYQRYLWFFLGLVLAHKASVKVAVPAVHTDFKQNLKSLSIQT